MKRENGNHWTRLCTLILALLMVFALGMTVSAAETEPEEPECYTQGDMNTDGAVDGSDAIYTLYRSLFGDQFYPVNQGWDFNGDGKMDNQDAIYLLYASLFPSDYHLDGVVHSYYDPSWKWSDDLTAVEVTFKCGCGQETVFSSEEKDSGVKLTEKVLVEPTCTAPGTVEYTATVTVDGQTYTSVKTGSVPALAEHQWKDDVKPDCEHSGECVLCGHKQEATGHKWELADTTEATCYDDAVEHYACGTCGETKDVELAGTAGHQYVAMETPKLIDEETCTYADSWCAVCQALNEEKTIVLHQYVAVLTKDATCSEKGIKTYTCRCGATNGTEEIPANGNHSWEEHDDGTGATHWCTVCHTTKTVVKAEEGKVDMSEHDSAVEVELGNDTTISLDADTAAGLEGQVQITVTETDKDDTGLTEEQKEQIPGDTVYDFNMKDANGEAITSFEGSVTISLPYTLAEGEDVDSIDIWYINDKGEPVRVEDAVYNNGFVTFTTTHFSYYTVTRLTPAERCDRYGHIRVEYDKDPTCTEDGYHKVICQRCGQTLSEESEPALGHDYTEDQKAATCTEEGYYIKTCHCGHKVSQILPALGHDLKLDKDHSHNASCKETGKTVYACAHGCGMEHEEKLPQQEHRYEISETVSADCSNKGYVKEKCALCGDERIKEETAPLGHSYVLKGWTWDEDYYGATLTLVCEHDPNHTKTQFAIAVSEEEKAVSCLGSGAMTYTVTACFNGQTFTDVKTVTTDAPGHQSDNVLHSNNSQHYYLCTVCQAKIGVTDHVWGEGNVTKAPTCAEDGTQTLTCTVCGHEKEETVPATGDHDFVYGVCKVCGFRSEACSHQKMHRTALNLSGYAICKGGYVELVSCDCGENSYLEYGFSCKLTFTEKEETDANGMPYYRSTAVCQDCGLEIVEIQYCYMLDEGCAAQIVVEYTVSLNGTVLAQTRMATEDMIYEHPPVIIGDTVDLKQYGICGDVLQYSSCPCGQSHQVHTVDRCDWNYDHEQGQWTCADCGTVRKNSYESRDGEDCLIYETETVIYYVDGEDVYNYINEYSYKAHEYVVTDYLMLGESCEDGVLVTYACALCGEIHESYTEGHVAVNCETIDLSGYNCCYDTLKQFTCPCEVAYQYFVFMEENGACEWVTNSYDPETQTETQICRNCGMTRTVKVVYGPKDDHCYGLQYEHITFTDTNGKSFTATQSSYTASHNWETSYELLGESCEDGVRISHECADCGESNSYIEYWHVSQQLEYYDLSQYGLCVQGVALHSCLCGRENNINWLDGWCNRQWIDGGDGYVTQQCVDCGLITHQTYRERYDEANCVVYIDYTLALSKDGQELAYFEWTDVNVFHNMEREYILKDGATSCEDGVIIRWTCTVCGESGEDEIYWHEAYLVSRETYGEGQMCGTVVVEKYSCACGQESWENTFREGYGCQYEGYYSEELGRWVNTCTVCGVSTWETVEVTPVEGETCWNHVAWHHIFADKAGVELFSYDTEHLEESHDILCSFNMLGETCQDGYNVIRSCTKCDYSYMEEAEIYYDCQAWTVGKEILHDGTGICGQIILTHRSCPCGQECRNNISTSCSLNWVEDVDNTKYFKCPVCETQTIEEYEIVREQGSCTATTMVNVSIIVNGETIGTYEVSWSWTEHSLVSTFEGSCEEGYYVTESCVRCDYSYREEELCTGHDRRRVEYIDLSEYGLCGGTIERYSCACGLQSHIQWGDICQWQSTELYDEEHQVWADYCPVCNTYRYHRISGERDPETCMYTENWWIKLVRNGETVLEKTYIRSYESHDSLAVGFIMNVEGGTCEDGYTVIWECKDCGHVTQHEDYGHYTFRTKTLVLSEECGAEIWWSSCPCGQETNISYNTCPMSGHYWEEVAEDGLLHGYFEMSCPECGLERFEDWRYVPTGEACQYDSYGTITFMMDGTVLATVQETGGITHHDHQVISMTLMEGADSCDEGVTVTYQCQGCGDTYEDMQYYHEQMLVEEIDLAPYGAVCGGTLKLYRCACGRESYYEFTKCDMDCKSVDHWVDGVIDEYGQDTSEGYQWYNSQSWMLTCAVTDPEACGLKIRMADVWVAEGCTAVRYEIWQLGYDEATGQCQREISWVRETRAYHAYTTERINQTLDDGTVVSGWMHTCPTCGSTYTEQYYYQNDQHVKTECIAINTLDNGENKKLTYLHEYGFRITGTDNCEHNLETRVYDEYIRADGTTEWYQHIYTYDEETFAANCTCTVTYTNSNGDSDTRTEQRHHWNYYETITQSTCTQDGRCDWYDRCVICGHVIDSGSHALEPNAHSWSWNEEMQTYVCMECGLESINGASGSIVLEDLSDDTDYVVGYWNRGNVEYLVNVSVILYEVAEGQEDQLVLSGITFSQREDVRAVSCSKSDVQAAAAAAMADAGYTGSYAIRISFVPTNSTDELDYAITFDAQ